MNGHNYQGEEHASLLYILLIRGAKGGRSISIKNNGVHNVCITHTHTHTQLTRTRDSKPLMIEKKMGDELFRLNVANRGNRNISTCPLVGSGRGHIKQKHRQCFII